MFVLFFIFVAIIGIIIIGLNLYADGQVSGDSKKTLLGNRLILAPIILIILLISTSFVFQKISFKPNKNDVVGIYEIEDVSGLEINENDFKNYKLELHENGAFNFINKPDEIDICDKGKYQLFYNEDNEGEFLIDCLNINSSAKIISNLNSFEIEFLIGDPDNGESISYKKIKN